MAEQESKYKAVITAVDDATATLKAVRAQIAGVEEQAHHATAALRFPRVHEALATLHERIEGVRGRFEKATEQASVFREKLFELVPAIAGLGALGSIAGLFEITERTAEKIGQLDAASKKLHIPAAEFSGLRFAAEASHVSVDALEGSLTKLNFAIGQAAVGKGKDLVSLFQHLKIDPRKVIDPADVLMRVSDVLEHTPNAGMQNRVMRALFGRGGADLLPLVLEGSARIKQLMAERKELTPSLTKEDKEGLEEYHHSILRLKTAVGGTMTEISAKLAPVLKPITEQLTQLILRFREPVANGLRDMIRDVWAYLSTKVDWAGIGTRIEEIASFLREAVEAVGGFKRVIEGLIALKVLGWAAGLVHQLERITAAAKITASAVRAVAGAETAGGAAGGAAAAGGAEAAGAGAAAGIGARGLLRWLGPVGAFAWGMWPGEAGAGEDDELRRLGIRNPVSSANLSRLVFNTDRQGGPMEMNLGPLAEAIRAVPGFHIEVPAEAFRGGAAGLAAAAAQSREIDQLAPVVTLRDPSATLGGGAFHPLKILGGVEGGVPADVDSPANGRVDVNVNFANVPTGARVNVTTQGDAAKPRVNVGYRFDGFAGLDLAPGH